MKQQIIGITDCGKYQNYHEWIAAASPEIEIVNLSYRNNNFDDIKKCTGIILTGGEDVHPRFYNLPEYLPYCLPTDMDEQRDEFRTRSEKSYQVVVRVAVVRVIVVALIRLRALPRHRISNDLLQLGQTLLNGAW